MNICVCLCGTSSSMHRGKFTQAWTRVAKPAPDRSCTAPPRPALGLVSRRSGLRRGLRRAWEMVRNPDMYIRKFGFQHVGQTPGSKFSLHFYPCGPRDQFYPSGSRKQNFPIKRTYLPPWTYKVTFLSHVRKFVLKLCDIIFS